MKHCLPLWDFPTAFLSLMSLELRSITGLSCRGSQTAHSIINELSWSLVALPHRGLLSSALPACAPEPAAQAPEPPNPPYSFFAISVVPLLLWKLPSPSFSCKDDSFPHNLSCRFRSIFGFYPHAINHHRLGGLTQCIYYLSSRS